MGPHCLCKSRWLVIEAGLFVGCWAGVLAFGPWRLPSVFPRPFVSAEQNLPPSPCLLSCGLAFGLALTMSLLGPLPFPSCLSVCIYFRPTCFLVWFELVKKKKIYLVFLTRPV